MKEKEENIHKVLYPKIIIWQRLERDAHLFIVSFSTIVTKQTHALCAKYVQVNSKKEKDSKKKGKRGAYTFNGIERHQHAKIHVRNIGNYLHNRRKTTRKIEDSLAQNKRKIYSLIRYTFWARKTK